MTTNHPIASLPLWEGVLRAAANRCQCTGQCGHRHKAVDGRCEHEHGGYASKHAAPIRLAAAPADPAGLARPVQRQAAMTASELMAWCPPCLDDARRRAQRAALKARAEQQQADSFALFDL
ncbi:hypothetical protein [Streptacidiphilus monticola]|uniref:Holin n=1 Tax=Streptacidiphilus monticola TaxID=2161674 RepID=A0ABW1GCT5_9ACTN